MRGHREQRPTPRGPDLHMGIPDLPTVQGHSKDITEERQKGPQTKQDITLLLHQGLQLWSPNKGFFLISVTHSFPR